MRRELGIRWTIGDVSQRGFEALRLSIWGPRLAYQPHLGHAVPITPG
ncbi:hypothetical protein [Chelativorans sp.]|nr:hypothetical protein [Chelativorans sp.]